jgi:PAS domain S-box-containing protein
MPTRTTTLEASGEPLDALALIQAGQALSGHLGGAQVVETLLQRAMEYAHAQTGCVFLVQQAELWLAAEANREGPMVRLHCYPEPGLPQPSLPRSLLNHVHQQHETVFLADVAAPHPFSADPYFTRQPPQSLVCLPLLRQAAVSGLLYLENILLPQAFPPDRLAGLEFLAAQAALALENARRYDDLQRARDELAQQIQQQAADLARAQAVLHEQTRERQQAEATLAAERNLLRTLIDNLPDCIYAKDAAGRFILGNPALARVMGAATPEALLGKTDFDFYPQDLAAQYDADEQAILQTGQPLLDREEFNLTPTTGETRWNLTVKVPLRDSQGNVTGLVGISHDITERKRAEEELRKHRDHLEELVAARTAEFIAANAQLHRQIAERQQAEDALRTSQHLLQSIIDNSTTVIYVKDVAGRYRLINRRYEELFHVTRAGVVGKTDYDLFPPERASAFRAFDQQVLAAGRALEAEEVAPQDDGLHTYISIKCPLYDETGQPYAVCGISTDITERKQAADRELRRRIWLEKVLELGKTAAQVTDWQTCLLTIYECVRYGLEFDRVGFFLYDLEQNVVRGAYGTSRAGEREETSWFVEPVTENTIFREGLSSSKWFVYTPDYSAQFPHTPERDNVYDVKEHAVVAAWAGDRPVAILAVDNVITGRPMLEEQLEALRLFASYAGLAVENARLYSALQGELAERRRAEEALRVSEGRYRQAIIAAGAVPYSIDYRSDTYTFMGEGILQMTGYPVEAMTPALWQSLIQEGNLLGPLADLPPAEAMRRVRAGEIMEWKCDNHIRTRSGESRWLNDSSFQVLDEQGQVIGAIGILQDITDRKQAIDREQRRRAWLGKVLELSTKVSQVTDLQACLLAINESVRRGLEFDRVGVFLFDAAENALRGAYGTSLTGELEDTRWYVQPLGEDAVLEHILRDPKGFLFISDYTAHYGVPPESEMYGVMEHVTVAAWAGDKPVAVMSVDNRLTGRPMSQEQIEALRLFAGYVGFAIENARLYAVVQRELAERQRAEATLQASERRYRTIFETVAVGLWEEDFSGVMALIADLKAQGVRDFDQYLADHPEMVAEAVARVRILDVNPETLRLHGAASKAALLVPLPQLFVPESYQVFRREMVLLSEGGQRFEAEVTFQTLDGERRDTLLTIIFPDPGGDSANTLVSMLDITERVRAEEKIHTLNAELEQRVLQRTAELAAANQELEAFTYSVSHDLRAPLRAMAGFSRILLQDYAPQLDAQAQQYLQRVQQGAQHMSRLIDDLLSFSRWSRQPPQKQTVVMTALVRQVLDDLRPDLLRRTVEFALGDLPECQADPVLLKQVLLNLLGNAVKYTREREVARIEVGAQARRGETVYFVKDNGVGFDIQYVHKLFEVFQRLHTSDEFEGTGVGLAIVQRIIARHGGRVWAEGVVGQGATFYFTLPTPESG